ncbi:MAG: glycine--tRNA ligase [Planctomycetales bacterium]
MNNRMEKIVALCKRRGFIFQSSEIYGGIQGFWDYGPLGTELKRNVREAWYRDMVATHDELAVPPGAPSAFSMVGMETSIIMHPQVWKVSGHYDLFVDKMVDCRKCKARYRGDHVRVKYGYGRVEAESDEGAIPLASGTYMTGTEDADWSRGKHSNLRKSTEKLAGEKKLHAVTIESMFIDRSLPEYLAELREYFPTGEIPEPLIAKCPRSTCDGQLTAPREFNLMFKTIIGALGSEEDAAFLRPETAQGMFVNFKNVLDSTRVKPPFGIAQVGKSFRNEITPRNFTFRSREFEQMEMEFFCRPDQSKDWYRYWRDRRFQWYLNLGITSDNLQLRDHAQEELAHYSVGTADIEYAFPFLEPGEYGELEGVAHRGDFDLRSHAEGKLVAGPEGCFVVETDANGQPKYKGSGKDLQYFDDQTRERFYPHVIEPAAGADRATLAFLCEAYHEDEAPDEKGAMQTRTVLKLHPRLAPIKAAVLPLIKKEGMPEKAAEIYRDLKRAGLAAYYDQQGAIGRRYRRQDEAGTPFCITIDGQTATDDTVTLRNRDTLEQIRVPVQEIVETVRQRVE